MKKQTDELKTKPLFPLKTVAGLLTAGVLLFGAASCGNERGNEENATEVENGVEVEDEGLGYEGMEDNQEVNNLAVEDEWNEWDANDDNQWDENEFETVANEAGLYEGWDADNNGMYEENEVYEGVFNSYDENGDNMLGEDEFNTWNTAWGGEYDNEWSEWDANDDNMLDYNEYEAGVGEAGVFNKWDTDNDGAYSEDELNSGLYGTWDMNDDGYLNEEEYNQIGYNF